MAHWSIRSIDDPRGLVPDPQVRRIEIEGCTYPVSGWRACFNALVSHCFKRHRMRLVKFARALRDSKGNEWLSACFRFQRQPTVPKQSNLPDEDGNARQHARWHIQPKLESVVPTRQGDPKDLNSAMSRICEACHIERADVRIVCAQGDENRPPQARPIVPMPIPIAPRVESRHLASRKEDPVPRISANAHDGSVHEIRLSKLLSAEFANGVRPGSIIDRNRIRKLYCQYFGESLPDGFDFVTALPKVGFVYDGKVFPRPMSGDGGLKSLIESCVNQGHVLFQFSRFMELHADKLMHMGIVSVGMLHDVIQSDAGDVYDVSDDFFAPKADLPMEARIESAIVQDAVVVDVKDTSKRLPYVDEDAIRRLCANADNMIWNGSDAYAVLGRISFDESEVEKGVSSCDASVGKDGFFSLVHLNLVASEALNDRRLSDKALRHAFFLRFLSGRFDLHGQIVCARGAEFDAQAPLRSFCRGRSVVTLSVVEAVAKEYRIAGYLALQTLHDEMVRVDAGHFASPALVAFDIPATDACIGALAVGRATPFGDVCHYAALPAVPGYVWNGYLLESYLRRVSKRFRILKQGVVSKEPVGVVVPVSGELVPLPHSDRYDGKLVATAFAYAASAAGIPPKPDAVGDFLCASRCVMRCTKSVIEATVAAMCAKERD